MNMFAGTAQAVQFNPDTGGTETAEYIDINGERILVYSHMPGGEPRGGVIICGSFGLAFSQNYRREVLLARSLADRGIAVRRFHYRGFGESSGDSSETSFESMLEDALCVSGSFVAELKGRPLAIMGTNWGAQIASASAEHLSADALALWDPVVSGRDLFRQIFRARWAGQFSRGGSTPTTSAELLEAMQANGSVDILGYPLSFSFYEDALPRQIDGCPESRPMSVLIVSMGARGRPSKAHVALRDLFADKGHDADVVCAAGDETWWVSTSDGFVPEERRPLTASSLEATLSWMEQVFDGSQEG